MTSFSFGSFGTAAPAPPAGAPAPSAFSFGSTPAPATGAPAPPAFGFGATTPAPPTTAAPAAPFSFGPTPGAAPPTTSLVPQQQQPQQPTVVSGGTPYNNLPPDIKAAIDKIHEAMMKHKRTVLGLQSIGPSQLEERATTTTTHSNGSSSSNVSLPLQIRKLNETLTALERASRLQTVADTAKDEYEALYKQATIGLWSLEQLAVQRRVHLRPIPSEQKQQKETTDAKTQLREVLDRQMAHVDRFERMPSQYLWQVLEDMKKRLVSLERRMWTAQQQHQNSMRNNTGGPTNIAIRIQEQQNMVSRANKYYNKLQMEMDNVRTMYRFYEKGENVLDKARTKEESRERDLTMAISMQFVQASAPPTTTAGAPAAAAPAPFGQPPGAPATAAPKPPTSTFGGFGFGAPTPAPPPAFSFSSTPAPAAPGAPPTTAAPAPPAFGAAPVPPLGFGSATTSTTSTFSSVTPKSKSKGRSKSRSGR